MTGFSRFLEIETQLRSSTELDQHRCMTCCPELRPKLTDDERERLAAWDRHVAVEDRKAAEKGEVLLMDPPAEIQALREKAIWIWENAFHFEQHAFLREEENC